MHRPSDTYYDQGILELAKFQATLRFEAPLKDCCKPEFIAKLSLQEYREDLFIELGGLLEESLLLLLEMAKKYKNYALPCSPPRSFAHYLMEQADFFAKQLREIKINCKEKKACFLVRTSPRILAQISVICEDIIHFSKPGYELWELAEDFAVGCDSCKIIEGEPESFVEAMERTKLCLATFILVLEELEVCRENMEEIQVTSDLENRMQALEEILY